MRKSSERRNVPEAIENSVPHPPKIGNIEASFPRAHLWHFTGEPKSRKKAVVGSIGSVVIDVPEMALYGPHESESFISTFKKFHRMRTNRKLRKPKKGIRNCSILLSTPTNIVQHRPSASVTLQGKLENLPSWKKERSSMTNVKVSKDVFMTEDRRHHTIAETTSTRRDMENILDVDSIEDEEARDEVNVGNVSYFGPQARRAFFALYQKEASSYQHTSIAASHTETTPSSDARTNFLSSCHAQTLVPEPMQIIRRHPSNTMALQNYGLGDDRAVALSQGLKTLPPEMCCTVNLSDNRLTWKGVSALSGAMQKGAEIAILNLSHNNIGVRGASLLGQALVSSYELKTIVLDDNHLGEIGIAQLCAGLLFNQSLTSLSLKSTHMGSKGATRLAEVLTGNSPLTHLNCAWNAIRGTGALALVKALSDNSTLQHIDLSWNAIGVPPRDETATYLATCLGSSTSSLKTLILTHNRFQAKSIVRIVQGMFKSPSLVCLHLDDNIGAGEPSCLELETLRTPLRLNENSAWIYTRIAETDKNVSISQEWKEGMFCYVCQEWRTHQFIYTPLLSGPVGHSIQLCIWDSQVEIKTYEMLWDDSIISDKILYSVTIYVPQNEIMYSFLVDGISVWAADHLATLNLAKESLRKNLSKAWKNSFSQEDFEHVEGPPDISRVNVLESLRSEANRGTTEVARKPLSVFSTLHGPSVYLVEKLRTDLDSLQSSLLFPEATVEEAEHQLEAIIPLLTSHYAELHELYRYFFSAFTDATQSPLFTFNKSIWRKALREMKLYENSGKTRQSQSFISLEMGDLIFEQCADENETLPLSGFLTALILVSKRVEPLKSIIQQLHESSEEDELLSIHAHLFDLLENRILGNVARDQADIIRKVLNDGDVITVFHAYQPSLLEIYATHVSGLCTQLVAGRYPRLLTFSMFNSILSKAGLLLDGTIRSSDARLAFACSLDLPVHEINPDVLMSLPEFFESIGRLGLLFADRCLPTDRKPTMLSRRPKLGYHAQYEPGLHPGPWKGFNGSIDIPLTIRLFPIFDVLVHSRVQGRSRVSNSRLVEWKTNLEGAFSNKPAPPRLVNTILPRL